MVLFDRSGPGVHRETVVKAERAHTHVEDPTERTAQPMAVQGLPDRAQPEGAAPLLYQLGGRHAPVESTVHVVGSQRSALDSDNSKTC